jgi:phospholipid-transporting ATPase
MSTLIYKDDDKPVRSYSRRALLKLEEVNYNTIRPIATTCRSKYNNIYFGEGEHSELIKKQNKRFGDNKITTTKYNLLTWLPKNILFQFRRIANIYFLIICILTGMSFSPKNPYTQSLSFIIVIIVTLVKEGIEDYRRYKSDKMINNRIARIYNKAVKDFCEKKWSDLMVGEIIKVQKNEQICADILILESSLESGYCFVDTKDLDGETNLKEKQICTELRNIFNQTTREILSSTGVVECEPSNEFLESWEGTVILNEKYHSPLSVSIKQLLLRGSILKNTDYIYGIIIYNGHNTKIMKNSKNPKIKISNVMRTLNIMLISLFIFQILICVSFSCANLVWSTNSSNFLPYLNLSVNKHKQPNFIISFFTFLIAFSHLIPISLYVTLEGMKVIQMLFIYYDSLMYDKELKFFSHAKTSELIEELGQIEFIFSDKTGTLTQNSMEFKKYFINNKIHHISKNDQLMMNQTISSERRGIFVEREFIKYESDRDGEENFFNIAAICHSVLIENDLEKREQSQTQENSGLSYMGNSPDEIAFIKGANQNGYIFFDRTVNFIKIQNTHLNMTQKWEILLEIPFDSNRKRMSLVVKDMNTKKIWIFTKGADEVLLPLIELETGHKIKINGNF